MRESRTSGRIALHRETIRELNGRELESAGGGQNPTPPAQATLLSICCLGFSMGARVCSMDSC